MKRKNIWIFVLSFIFLTVSAAAALYVHAVNGQKCRLVISYDSGIYGESVEVTVKKFAPGVVYYTVNGARPDPEKVGDTREDTMIYEGPIYLELQDETSLYSLQFYCEFEDGTVSEVYKRDYILDKEGQERFSTTYTVAITGDEEKLFGYEEGIFVRGRVFDEYMEANEDPDIYGEEIPANYLSNAEIPVNAAIFLQDGTQVINQNCGVRIYGNATRVKNQKSFRLTARYEYDDVNEFSYAFLPNLVSEEGKTVVDAFQRLSFHNSGNDNGYAFIRTELIGELARRSGFPDVLVAESATVYINGRYQGVYWIENAFDDRYFKEKYGNYNGEMVVCEGYLCEMYLENAESDAEKRYSEEYNEFCLWAQTVDMTDDKDWDRVCSMIDVENFARYMAIEYYVGNKDWPHSNVKVYRYQAALGEAYREGTVFDGRYRYLLFDTDYGMGLKFLDWFGSDENTKRLKELSVDSDLSALFRSLLQREEFRVLFVNSVMDLMGGSFSYTTVSVVLHEYNMKRIQELEYMMAKTDLLKNSLWESDDNNIGNVSNEIMEILRFAENRPSTVLGELQDLWGCGGAVTLSVNTVPGSRLSVGGLQTDDTDYQGLCLENVPVEIKAEAGPGVTVKGYYVNSGFMAGDTITIMPGECQEEGYIVVEPVFETEAVESLEISAYHIRGTEDYVILRNNGQTTLLLSDYAVTDSDEQWSKGRLPDMMLEPGEEYLVYGGKYSGEMAENSMQVPFSWNSEEEILLIHVSNGVVDRKNVSLQWDN